MVRIEELVEKPQRDFIPKPGVVWRAEESAVAFNHPNGNAVGMMYLTDRSTLSGGERNRSQD